jgi:O-antigen/teichoic acid export membrane protein
MLSTLSSFTAINSSLLIGREKIAKSNIVNFLVPFLTLSFLFVQFYFFDNKSISAYVSALVFSYLLSLVCSLYFIKAYFFEKETQDSKFQTTFKSLFYFGFQNQLAHIFQLLSFRISYFVIEHYNGKEAVGIYSNGISIAEAIWMITSSICLYQYSKISNSTDKEYSMRLTEKLTKVALFISFLVICVVAIIPTNFYTWVFGKEFYELKSIILLLLPGVWIYNYYLIIGHYFSGRGKFLSNALATFIGLVFTFLLIFSLVPKFGVQGSVLSAILTYLLTSLVAIIIYLCQGGKFVLFPKFSEIQNYLFSKTNINEKSK